METDKTLLSERKREVTLRSWTQSHAKRLSLSRCHLILSPTARFWERLCEAGQLPAITGL